MNCRKIILITLVVLVLVALMYKMSERYVYSNTVPTDFQTLLEKPEMNFKEDQKEFLVFLYTAESVQNDPKGILKSLTDNQRNALIGIVTKYKPQIVKYFYPKTTVPSSTSVMNFNCTKSPDSKIWYNCKFS